MPSRGGQRQMPRSGRPQGPPPGGGAGADP